jgi:hypothetical protein
MSAGGMSARDEGSAHLTLFPRGIEEASRGAVVCSNPVQGDAT